MDHTATTASLSPTARMYRERAHEHDPACGHIACDLACCRPRLHFLAHNTFQMGAFDDTERAIGCIGVVEVDA